MVQCFGWIKSIYRVANIARVIGIFEASQCNIGGMIAFESRCNSVRKSFPCSSYKDHDNFKSFKMATHSSYICSEAYSRFFFLLRQKIADSCGVSFTFIHLSLLSERQWCKSDRLPLNGIGKEFSGKHLVEPRQFFWSNKYGLSPINYQFHAVFHNLPISKKKNC